MSAAQDHDVEAIAQQAVQISPGAREQYLLTATQGNPLILERVRTALRDRLSDTPTVQGLAPAPAVVPGAPEVGQRIGAYRVVRELGRGGMGVVFLAREEADHQIARRVAIKVIRRGMDSEDVLRRFNAERQFLSALNHPNIARVYEGGLTEDGRPYFVLEYIEGTPITRYCDSNRLTITERLTLFRKICLAVHYAHQNLIVHRDLKPGNIMVTKDGEPKLVDFGIAKLLSPDLGSTGPDLTRAETRLLTPEYASPEQIRGEPITTASDIYSLGVILYEITTGHRPYQSQTQRFEDIQRLVCERDPARPSDAVGVVEAPTNFATDLPASEAPGVGLTDRATITPESVAKLREGRPDRLRKRLLGDVDNIVLMAMRKEPRRRYASAEQLAEDISRHLEGRPVIARPQTLSYRVSKFVRRNRGAVAVSGLSMVAVTAVLTTGWYAAAADAADNERSAVEAQRDSANAIAQASLERAERTSRVADALTKSLESAMERLETLPGAVDARWNIASDLRELLAGVDQDVQSQPASVLRSLAGAHAQLALAFGGARSANRGDINLAIESGTRALNLRELVLQTPEVTSEDRARVSLARTSLAGNLLQARRPDEARAMAEKALSEAEAVDAAAGPLAVRARYASLATLADVHEAFKDDASAADCRDRSLSLRRAAYRALKPDDWSEAADIIRRDLTIGLMDSASILQTLDAKLSMIDEAIAIREDLTTRGLKPLRARRDLYVARLSRADALIQHGRFDDGLREAEAVAQSIRDAMRDDPGDQRARLDYAVVRLRLGRAEAGLGDHAKAREHFDVAAREAGALAFPGPHFNALRAQAEAIRRSMRASQSLEEPARVLQYSDALSAMLPPAEDEESTSIRSVRADNMVLEADALAWCGEVDRAERLLARAEQLDPETSPEKTITTAAVLLSRGQRADAREAAQAALDLLSASAATPGEVNSERDYWMERAGRIIETAGASAAP